MNTTLVWVLMTWSARTNDLVYSPPFATQAECERVKTQIPKIYEFVSTSKCVQMTVVVK